MLDLSANVAITITLIIVAAVSIAILVLRDRWRDRVGMPATERKRLEQNASRHGTVFLETLFGLVALGEFVHEYHSPDGTGWGFTALILLSAAFVTWANAKRRHDKSG
jgi:hypothetical protein